MRMNGQSAKCELAQNAAEHVRRQLQPPKMKMKKQEEEEEE